MIAGPYAEIICIFLISAHIVGAVALLFAANTMLKIGNNFMFAFDVFLSAANIAMIYRCRK